MQHFFNSLKLNQTILTSQGYFPNKNKGCGITSLANLIYIKYGDFNTAMRIYVNSRKHPLVKDGTTDITSFPILLEELSRSKYSGICYLNPSLDYNLDNSQLKGDFLNILKNTFKTSLERELIVLKRDYSVNYPNILFLMSDDENLSGHALVNKEHSTFINNGYIQHSLPNGFDIEGIFDAFKK
jgi:hypothetical protein